MKAALIILFFVLSSFAQQLLDPRLSYKERGQCIIKKGSVSPDAFNVYVFDDEALPVFYSVN